MMRFRLALLAMICAAPYLVSCAGNGAKTGDAKSVDAAASVKACGESADRHEGDKAIALCNDALALQDLSSEHRSLALAARGYAYIDKKDNEKALADFNQALTLKPDYRFALANRGWIHIQMGDFDSAIADFDKVIAQQPEANAYSNRSFAYNMKGEFAAGLHDLDRAIALEPGIAETYNDRGWTHMMLGEMGPALADMSHAIDMNSKLGRIYENRSTLYFLQGRYALAIADMDRAQEIDPKNSFGYIWLYIATRRDHGDPAPILEKAAQADRIWPSVILRFIQGTASEQDVHDAVRQAQQPKSSVWDCHTEVILGELDLIGERSATAAEHFRRASSTCPRGQTERLIAETELKRM